MRIVDRKKELIINASGKNMSPTAIESMLTRQLPAHRLRRGHRRQPALRHRAAHPGPGRLRGLCRPPRPDATDPAALADDPVLRAELERGIEAANARLSRVEQVKRWTVLPGAWLPGGDELTPTMKLKRRPIESKYAEQIAALYP